MKPKYPQESAYNQEFGFICHVHDGVAFPMSNSVALHNDIENFECDPSDVYIIGFSKSGTNWLQAMVQKLYDDDWGTVKLTGGVVPHIDIGTHMGVIGYEYCEAAEKPRLMKGHCHYRHMPRQFREKKSGKVLYVARNPKDVCDSFYNQMDVLREPQGFTPDWAEWVERFVEGKVPYGPWLNHVIEWLKHEKDGNVMPLFFEDMKKDVRATLQSVVEFIGRPVSDAKISQVIDETEFSKMQQGEGAKLYNGPVARRQGRAGGWRTRFTDAQNQLFEEAILKKLNAEGIRFDFG